MVLSLIDTQQFSFQCTFEQLQLSAKPVSIFFVVADSVEVENGEPMWARFFLLIILYRSGSSVFRSFDR